MTVLRRRTFADGIYDLPPRGTTPYRSPIDAPYSLTLKTPPTQGSVDIGPAPGVISEYWRTIRWDGGFWYGGFKVTGDVDVLQDWFYNKLFHQVVEQVAGFDVWDGLITEIDYVALPRILRFRKVENANYQRLRRSLTDVFNRVKVEYINPEDDSQSETSWITDDTSIAKWGQRDLIVRAEVNDSRAADEADAQLKLSSWPNVYMAGIEQADEPFVEVTMVGFIHTANYRYVTTADDSSSTVSAWLTSLIGTDCEFLTAHRIETISTSITQSLDTPRSAWEQIQTLLSPADSGNLYRINTLLNGQTQVLNAYPIPIGFLSNGILVNVGMEPLSVNPRFAQPGVYRNLDNVVPASFLGDNPFLLDGRDFIVEEMEVDRDGNAVPHIVQMDYGDSLRLLVNA